MSFRAIRNLWRRRLVRSSAAGASGMSIAFVPALLPSEPVWGLALIASPLLVWYACFSLAEMLFPKASRVSKVAFSLMIYFGRRSGLRGFYRTRRLAIRSRQTESCLSFIHRCLASIVRLGPVGEYVVGELHVLS